jgi:TolB protein
VDADGRNLRRIVRRSAFWPRWSPDGKTVVFSDLRGSSPGIYVMDTNGKNLRRIGQGWSPSWSPDGKQIAFASGRGGAGFELYVMNADGSASTG